MSGRLVVSLSWMMAMLSAGVLFLSTNADPRPSSFGAYRRGEDRLLEALRSRRNHQCVSASGSCFASGQCCMGLVCASMDDYLDLKPQTPGYCVKEKDLQSCEDGSDCAAGTRCLPLGRSSELYCMPAPPAVQRLEVQSAGNVQPPRGNPAFSGKLGALGADCETSADCSPFLNDDPTTRLCCQVVRRFRQQPRRVCDRFRDGISVCIGPERR